MIENILFGIFIFCFLFVVVVALVFVAINLFGLIPGIVLFSIFAGAFVFWFYKTLKDKNKEQ